MIAVLVRITTRIKNYGGRKNKSPITRSGRTGENNKYNKAQTKKIMNFNLNPHISSLNPHPSILIYVYNPCL